MRNKKIICFYFGSFFLLCLAFILFRGVLLKNSTIHPVELENIKMEIKEGTLTRSGATIVITDLGEKKTTFGNSYIIEKKIFNHWKVLQSKKEWWTLEGYQASLDENNQRIMPINWIDNYGNLDKGEYRLLKDVGNQYISVKFKIN